MFLTNNASIQEVLFFPQMRPEKTTPKVELNEDDKIIIEILEKNGGKMNLADVKTQSQFSGKKWDKTSKNLTKLNVVMVEKNGDDLLMKLV